MSYKTLFATILAAASALVAPDAGASTAQTGYISGLYSMDNGAVLFSTTGSRDTPPACQHPGLPKRWALNASTANGQNQVAQLLTAYAQHKPVWVLGTGVCNIWGDTETVDWFVIVD